jgi:hypothetical protein
MEGGRERSCGGRCAVDSTCTCTRARARARAHTHTHTHECLYTQGLTPTPVQVSEAIRDLQTIFKELAVLIIDQGSVSTIVPSPHPWTPDYRP